MSLFTDCPLGVSVCVIWQSAMMVVHDALGKRTITRLCPLIRRWMSDKKD